MNIYKIPENRLLELLEAESRLQVLESDGVDNWTWYMEGKFNYLRESAQQYDLNLKDNENFDFSDLALLELSDFERI